LTALGQEAGLCAKDDLAGSAVPDLIFRSNPAPEIRVFKNEQGRSSRWYGPGNRRPRYVAQRENPVPKPIARLLVLTIELVSLPLMILSYLLFVTDFAVRFRATRLPITAYSLLFGRWIFDRTGQRPDPACRQLVQGLPGGLTWIAHLIGGAALWAMRSTGVTLFGLVEYPVYNSTSIADYLGQRTRFLDDALYRSLETVEQVVILGAGWDTRAYNLVRQADVRVYEVDTAQMQTAKRRALARARIDPSGVVFCTADLNHGSWLEALEQVGLDPGKPTFVLWEGVTYYLTPTAVEATLQTVATQLAAGSAIAFDYFSKHYVEGGELSLLPPLFASAFHWVGEPHLYGISTEPPARAQLAALLSENGLELAEFEPVGKGDEQNRVDGGLALAVN
jgi:methyltransferase (TIGR00027 family)